MIEMMANIKGTCENYIYSFYSTTKQLCINELQGFNQQDKDTMWVFINACRERSNQLESLYLNGNLTMEDINYSDISPGV